MNTSRVVETVPLTLTSLDSVLDKRSESPLSREIQGELFLYAFQNWHRLADYEESESIPFSDTPTLYFGLGSEPRARKIIQSGEHHRVYEPDPHRLNRFYEQYSETLKEGDWKLGTGLWLEEGFLDGLDRRVVHPLAEHLYDPLPTRMAEKPERLVEPGTLLVQIGDLFYRDVVETLKRSSLIVWPIELDHWSPEGIRAQLEATEFESIFSINLIEDLPQVCAETGLQYTCWEIDPSTSPFEEVSPEASEATWMYTYRRKNVLRLRAVGYEHVEYCPLASSPVLRRPLEDVDSRYEAGVSFVGSSMRQNAREQLSRLTEFIESRGDDRIEWSRLLETIERWKESPPDWDEDTLGEIHDTLEEFGIPFEVTIDGSTESVPLIIAEYRAYQKRADVIETVGNQFEINVWGDRGWVDHTGEHGTYRGEAGHGDELTRIYNASRINLDVNRIYQPNIVTMRVFDVMACGSLVLSERCESIESLLNPGKDVVLYSDREDLLETIETLLNDDETVARIGREARQSVEREHNLSNRMSRMPFYPDS